MFKEIAQELGELVDKKQEAYGDSITGCGEILKQLCRHWKKEDGLYHIPESLLIHLAMLVRIIDKLSRISSNPNFDLMGESPYRDIAGYGLLGYKLMNQVDNSKKE